MSTGLRWKLDVTGNGRLVVNDEIRDVLADRAARVALGQLMTRLQFDRALPRDTAALGGGLLEALYEFVDDESVPEDAAGMRQFFNEHTAELLPLLRQAISTAPSQVWPIKPIMLDVLAEASVDDTAS